MVPVRGKRAGSVSSLSCTDVTVWRGPDLAARHGAGASNTGSLSANRRPWSKVLAPCKDGGYVDFPFRRETARGSSPAGKLWILFVL